MSSTAMRDRTAAPAGSNPSPPPGSVLGRRVNVPRVLLGAVLVLGFALAGAVVAKRVDTRVPVLATTHSISAGQTIADADVTVVRVAAGAGVAVMPGSQRASVVGRTAAIPLPAGVLLAPAQLGSVAWPELGQAVIAVGVKPGHGPAGLAPGVRVAVLVVPSTGGAPGAAATSAVQVVQADATVVAVQPAADQSGISVVSLLLDSSDAIRVVSTPGEVSLVQLGVGR